MELRVVGVLVILYAVVSDDVGDWAAVDCEQQRAKHRPLRDTHVDFSGVTLGVTGSPDPPLFSRGRTDPLTFCDHLVPKYYKSKAVQLWRAANAYTGINSDCHEYICKYVNQRPYWTV